MTNSRRCLLFLGLIVVSLSPLIACNKSTPPDTITTYTNENWNYSIKYPLGWEAIKVSLAETKLVTSFKTRPGFIIIFVLRNTESLPTETAVERYILAIESKYTDFKLLQNTRMQGSWDWYIAYDFLDEYDRMFHGETYFKQVLARIYKIETIGEKEKYDEYNFKPIVSTFTVLK